MIGPLEGLKHEHRLIERVLAALERATQALECGDDVLPETLEQALTFVRGFAAQNGLDWGTPLGSAQNDGEVFDS